MKTLIQTIVKGKEAVRKEQLEKLAATGEKHIIMFNRFNQAKLMKDGEGKPVKHGDLYAVYNNQIEFLGTILKSGQVLQPNN